MDQTNQNKNQNQNDQVQYSTQTFKRVYQNDNGNEFEAQYDSTNPDNCYKIVKQQGEQPRVLQGAPRELHIEGQQLPSLEQDWDKQNWISNQNQQDTNVNQNLNQMTQNFNQMEKNMNQMERNMERSFNQNWNYLNKEMKDINKELGDNNTQTKSFKRVYQNLNGNEFEAQYDSTNPDNCYKMIKNKGDQPKILPGIPKEFGIQNSQQPQLEADKQKDKFNQQEIRH